IPELLPYSDQVYFGKTPKEFVNQVKKALSEDSPEKQIARQIIAKKNTWEMRAKSIETKIKSLVFPKVSIVILIYNQPRLSKIAIESVLNRSKYPNFELILVDNKSNFETLKMLKTYQTQPNVKLILNSENLGFAKGNNLGMKTATGEYIVLLNNDVRVTPGWIERLVYHVRGSKAGLVGPVTNSIGNESKIEINYESSNLTQMEA
ncbi:MAG TPA: glycosyl transferase, partial [Candidatus Pacebacteria bacterium]|nr:glycosyl transferase [Candidatus Paceibacterota bacterium]